MEVTVEKSVLQKELGIISHGVELTVQFKDNQAQALFTPNWGNTWNYSFVLCPVRV